PYAIGPHLRPPFGRSKKLVALKSTPGRVSQGLQHQQISGRATCERLVVADFQEPKSTAGLDRNLSCRGVPGNLQKADAQNSFFTCDGRVLLEEPSPIRIGHQRRTGASFPIGSLDPKTLGEQRRYLIRLGRGDFVFNVSDFLSCSQRSPQARTALGA